MRKDLSSLSQAVFLCPARMKTVPLSYGVAPTDSFRQIESPRVPIARAPNEAGWEASATGLVPEELALKSTPSEPLVWPALIDMPRMVS
jgi:hypothetical protein